MGIKFRQDVLPENVKFYFKVIYTIKADCITRQIFSIFVE